MSRTISTKIDSQSLGSYIDYFSRKEYEMLYRVAILGETIESVAKDFEITRYQCQNRVADRLETRLRRLIDADVSLTPFFGLVAETPIQALFQLFEDVLIENILNSTPLRTLGELYSWSEKKLRNTHHKLGPKNYEKINQALKRIHLPEHGSEESIAKCVWAGRFSDRDLAGVSANLKVIEREVFKTYFISGDTDSLLDLLPPEPGYVPDFYRRQKAKHWASTTFHSFVHAT